jgi:hypothetical protein
MGESVRGGQYLAMNRTMATSGSNSELEEERMPLVPCTGGP